MQIRRPIAALFIALALVGGGVPLTACAGAGQDQNDGTTDDSNNTGGSEPSEDDQGNLPDNSNEDPDDTDTEEDPQ
jgi:hypothetical protein